MKPEELEVLLRRIPELQPSPELEDRIRNGSARRRPSRALLPVAASLIFCLAGLWFALGPSPHPGSRGKPQDSSFSIRFDHEGSDAAERCRDERHWKIRAAGQKAETLEDLEKILQSKNGDRSEQNVEFIGDAATPWSLIKRARSACKNVGLTKTQWRLLDGGKKEQILDIRIPTPKPPPPPQTVILEPVMVMLRWDADRKELVRSIGRRTPALSDEELTDSIQRMIVDYKKAGKTECPVYLEAAGDVSWKEIAHVIDLCKARQFDPIEFEYVQPELIESIPRPRDQRKLPRPSDD